MTESVDLIVIGAGPAGSAAAIRYLQLRPTARVVLLDKAAFPRDWSYDSKRRYVI